MNPFKVGDKVKSASAPDGVHFPAGAVYTVLSVGTLLVTLDSPHPRVWHHDNLVAAIAGVDYPATKRDDNNKPLSHLEHVAAAVALDNPKLPTQSTAGKWMGHGGSVRDELPDMPQLFYSGNHLVRRGVSPDTENTPKAQSLGAEPLSGHLPDGSSVQKHSAGGLYPVVVWHRDKMLPGKGKYDVGLTWPDQSEPVWFREYNTAVAVAESIKENLK